MTCGIGARYCTRANVISSAFLFVLLLRLGVALVAPDNLTTRHASISLSPASKQSPGELACCTLTAHCYSTYALLPRHHKRSAMQQPMAPMREHSACTYTWHPDCNEWQTHKLTQQPQRHAPCWLLISDTHSRHRPCCCVTTNPGLHTHTTRAVQHTRCRSTYRCLALPAWLPQLAYVGSYVGCTYVPFTSRSATLSFATYTLRQSHSLGGTAAACTGSHHAAQQPAACVWS